MSERNGSLQLDWGEIDSGWEEPAGDKKRRTRARGKKRRPTQPTAPKQRKQRARRPPKPAAEAALKKTPKRSLPPWLLPAVGFVVALGVGALVLLAAAR